MVNCTSPLVTPLRLEKARERMVVMLQAAKTCGSLSKRFVAVNRKNTLQT